jgi:sugar phosphate isomerase/epimerase
MWAGCARPGQAVGSAALGSSVVQSPFRDRIGVQLYTVRDLLQQDFEGTIERVARIGYKEVEFAGYYNRPPEQVRALLDRLGITAPSSHIAANLLRRDMAGQIALAKTIGHRYITMPSYPVSRTGTRLEAWKAAAAEFNGWGAACRDAGLRFAYHNHNAELSPIDGAKSGFHVLLAETDPALVDFQLDIYWSTHAGVDAIELIGQNRGRFTMWHVKDMLDPLGAKTMKPVGQGAIDFARIFTKAADSGLRHFFVEDDSPASNGGSLASIQASFDHLRRLLA